MYIYHQELGRKKYKDIPIVISLKLAGGWMFAYALPHSRNGDPFCSVRNPVNDGPDDHGFQPGKVYLTVGIPGVIHKGGRG